MIIIKLFGGMCNQMFQYALGRYLELQNGCEVKYQPDEVWFPRLGPLNCKINYCSEGELERVRKEDNPIRLFSRKVGSALKPDVRKTIIEDYGHHFNPEILSIRHHCHLVGYWQTYLAVDAIRDTLLQEIRLDSFSTKYEKRLEQVKSDKTSVSMHIRRGDYLDPKANEIHTIIPLSYYRQATQWMVDQLGEIQVFVFSDDLAWAKQNVDWLNDPVFVETENHLEDLFLMAECEHNIIANSTFSWWAAWLNENDGKQVVYPRDWFTDREFNSENFIPQNWIAL